MKKIAFLIWFFAFYDGILFSQKLDSNIPPKLIESTETKDGFTKVIYQIKCTFTSAISDSHEVVDNIKHWKIVGEKNTSYTVKEIGTLINKKIRTLRGDWDNSDVLNLTFIEKDGTEQRLKVDASETKKKTSWGFGTGKALEFNAMRLTNQEKLYAFDYNFEVNIFEPNFVTPSGGFWFRSLSVSLISNGTLGSDDMVRNGSQTSIEFIANPFYFVGGFVYRGELKLGYQVEARMNDNEDKLFDIINKQVKLGLEAEIPLTNYPIFKLHTKAPYARLAMPVTVNLDYFFKRGDNDPGRLDFKARYELAFSPYFILQGEWHGTKFSGTPAGFDNTATYYSVAVAQDLDAVKKTLGFLKFILGSEEEIQGKNFIFFRISKGKKAPAFEDITERVIGFGTYF